MKTKKKRKVVLVNRYNGWRLIMAGLTYGEILDAFVKGWDLEGWEKKQE